MTGEVGPVAVRLTRSGGFAGTRLQVSVTTEGLPPEEAARLRELVERLNPDRLEARPAESPTRPDEFQYDLTIVRHGLQQHMRLHESAVTLELRDLLDFLIDLARKG